MLPQTPTARGLGEFLKLVGLKGIASASGRINADGTRRTGLLLSEKQKQAPGLRGHDYYSDHRDLTKALFGPSCQELRGLRYVSKGYACSVVNAVLKHVSRLLCSAHMLVPSESLPRLWFQYGP